MTRTRHGRRTVCTVRIIYDDLTGVSRSMRRDLDGRHPRSDRIIRRTGTDAAYRTRITKLAGGVNEERRSSRPSIVFTVLRISIDDRNTPRNNVIPSLPPLPNTLPHEVSPAPDRTAIVDANISPRSALPLSPAYTMSGAPVFRYSSD